MLETEPGRIEAIVLAPADARARPGRAARPCTGRRGVRATGPTSPRVRADVDAAVKAANATLAVHSRIAAWRFWPDVDFPRTHTLKVKRNQVRAWAAVAAPLPVTEAS